jgi:hypothetical protein
MYCLYERQREGFNPEYTDKLFGVFQLLHTNQELSVWQMSNKLFKNTEEKFVLSENKTNKGITFFISL